MSFLEESAQKSSVSGWTCSVTIKHEPCTVGPAWKRQGGAKGREDNGEFKRDV